MSITLETEQLTLRKLETLLHENKQLLQEIKDRIPETYFNAKEAAEYLGISDRLFNYHLAQGHWKNYKVGRRRLYRLRDLDSDMDKFKVTDMQTSTSSHQKT
jgi:excisionase family DNA binding protein